MYFTTNAIAADKQVPILLSSIGASTYSLLSNLVAPDSPGTKPFTEISNAPRKHYEPKRAVIVERFHFHKHDQAVGESMADFDAVHITTLCNFGENLEETLRCVVYVTILFNGNWYRKLTRRLWKFLQPDKIEIGRSRAEHDGYPTGKVSSSF